MPAPAAVLALIERFKEQQDDYLIDPLFAALGWDIDNRAGHAEAYKDVVHEDKLKIGGDHKAPDYYFRVGGTRKFFWKPRSRRSRFTPILSPPTSSAATPGRPSCRCRSSPIFKSWPSSTPASSPAHR